MALTRRQAIRAVTGMVAFLSGERVLHGAQSNKAAQYAKQSDLRLVLDGVAHIEVVYRGQARQITPQDVMDALGGRG